MRNTSSATSCSDQTNIFDVGLVLYLANEYGFYELVMYLETIRREHIHFILTGEAQTRRMPLRC
ncbi:MAG: DUF5049 domain-containing protein [Lachnospiraceae bacterium]|nr:DUF5049 domain-containing protein [Lachnospiraceae bacterium]